MALRVGLADDSLLIREALTRLLEDAPGIALLAVCADAEELLAAVGREQLDVVLVDICMPPTMTDEGIRLAAVLRESHPRVGVVVLSAYCEPSYALELLAGGSDGRAYLLKDRLGSRPQLLSTLTTVANGGAGVHSQGVGAPLAARGGGGGPPPPPPTPPPRAGRPRTGGG